MDFPILLTIRVENEKEYEIMLTAFQAAKAYCANTIGLIESVPLFERMQLRRFDGKQARLLLNGREVATGNLEDMSTKFKTECGIHKSNVALEEWVDGRYTQIKSRFVSRP